MAMKGLSAMKIVVLLVFIVGIAAALACPPAPQPPPQPPDASDASPEPIPIPPVPDDDDAGPSSIDASAACTRACAALEHAGCPIGTHADCPVVLGRDLASRKIENKVTHKILTCAAIQAVQTRADAQRIGFDCQ